MLVLFPQGVSFHGVSVLGGKCPGGKCPGGIYVPGGIYMSLAVSVRVVHVWGGYVREPSE